MAMHRDRSLKCTVSHRGHLQDKHLHVTSWKAAGKSRDMDLRRAKPPTLQGCRALVGSLLLCAAPRPSPCGVQCKGDWEEGRAGTGEGGSAPRHRGRAGTGEGAVPPGTGEGGSAPWLTGVMRMAGCAPQPCMARCSVSLNMLRSSTAWQYTASIRGHQSSADCKARAALSPSHGWGTQPSPKCTLLSECPPPFCVPVIKPGTFQ